MQYSYRYNVGDLVLRWTANPKIGLYGKLAYKSTGPYKIVGTNQFNRDVYQLVPLGRDELDPTSHHVRELVPYVTQEAHEQQHDMGIDQNHQQLLEVEVGQHLLLPNGKTDFLVVVKSKSGPYFKVHYYNTDQEDKTKSLKLVWWRQNPDSTEDDYQEVYQDTLTKSQVKGGFSAWEEEIHANLFYQRVVQDTDLKVTKNGTAIKRLRRAVIKRAAPLVPK